MTSVRAASRLRSGWLNSGGKSGDCGRRTTSAPGIWDAIHSAAGTPRNGDLGEARLAPVADRYWSLRSAATIVTAGSAALLTLLGYDQVGTPWSHARGELGLPRTPSRATESHCPPLRGDEASAREARGYSWLQEVLAQKGDGPLEGEIGGRGVVSIA